MASAMDEHGYFSLSLGPDYTMAAIAKARPFLGDVQIVTNSGDKHLMNYMAEPAAVCAAIAAAQAGRRA